jgi:WD40 repeat protein
MNRVKKSFAFIATFASMVPVHGMHWLKFWASNTPKQEAQKEHNYKNSLDVSKVDPKALSLYTIHKASPNFLTEGYSCAPSLLQNSASAHPNNGALFAQTDMEQDPCVIVIDRSARKAAAKIVASKLMSPQLTYHAKGTLLAFRHQKEESLIEPFYDPAKYIRLYNPDTEKTVDIELSKNAYIKWHPSIYMLAASQVKSIYEGSIHLYTVDDQAMTAQEKCVISAEPYLGTAYFDWMPHIKSFAALSDPNFQTITTWDLETGKKNYIWVNDNKKTIFMFKSQTTNSLLAVKCVNEETVRLIDITQSKQIAELPCVGHWIDGWNNEQQLLVRDSDYSTNKAFLFDIRKTADPIIVLQHKNKPVRSTFNRAGTMIASVSLFNELLTADVSSGKITPQPTNNGYNFNVQWTGDDKECLVTQIDPTWGPVPSNNFYTLSKNAEPQQNATFQSDFC